MMSERVNPKNLFAAVDEGDELMWGDRSEPVTVYRHVTEDDPAGQVITMRAVTEEMAEAAQWEVENGYHSNDAIRAGDLMTGSLTGDEFLIARGPRGGCYLLKQWWTKRGGEWFADIALFRRTQTDSEVWTWENTVDLTVVGSADVDRAEFDEGGDWTRHTEVDGVTVWENTKEGDTWGHSAKLTGAVPREPTDTGPEPWEVLETISAGDSVTVNDVSGTVTDAEDQSGGSLAGGLMVTLDAEGVEYRIRTFPEKGAAYLMTEDGDAEDVTDAEVSDG